MKKIISYIIHLFIMPCSQATLVMEQQQTQKLSLFRRLQLKAHLSLCKICAVYYKKLAFLEDVLTSEKKRKKNQFSNPMKYRILRKN